MKAIPYSEWFAQFEISEDESDLEGQFDDDASAFTFYDCGSVKRNADGDFVVKADQVRKI